jgi:hypothetical protein
MTRQVESFEDDAGEVVYYHRHENGGGFVGRGAVVADSVRLGLMTYVEPRARVASPPSRPAGLTPAGLMPLRISARASASGSRSWPPEAASFSCVGSG